MFKYIFITIVYLLTILIFKNRFKSDSKFLITIFTIALIIRMICATGIFLFNWYQGSSGFFSGDESVYYKRAVNIAVGGSMYANNIFDNTPELNGGAFALNLFSILESIFIFTFGKSLIFIKYCNCFIGALLPVFTYLLAKVTFCNKKIAKISACLIAFLPSMVAWSSIGIKEPIVILLITVFFYYYIKIIRHFNLFNLFYLGALVIALFYVQSNAALILIVICSIRLIFDMLSGFIKKKALVLICMLLCVSIVVSNQKKIISNLYEVAKHQAIQYVAGNQKSARYEIYPHKMLEIYFFDFYEHLIFSPEV